MAFIEEIIHRDSSCIPILLRDPDIVSFLDNPFAKVSPEIIKIMHDWIAQAASNPLNLILLLKVPQVSSLLGRYEYQGKTLRLQVLQHTRNWVTQLMSQNHLEQIFSPEGYLILGNLYSGVIPFVKHDPQDQEIAYACYSQVSKVSNEFPEARFQMASMLVRDGQTAAAIQVLSEVSGNAKIEAFKNRLLLSYGSSAVSEVLRKKRQITESCLVEPTLAEKQSTARIRQSFFGEFTAQPIQDYASVQYKRQQDFQLPRRLTAEA